MASMTVTQTIMLIPVSITSLTPCHGKTWGAQSQRQQERWCWDGDMLKTEAGL